MRKGDGAASAGRGDRRGWDTQSWEGRTSPKGPGVGTTDTNQSRREKCKILCGKKKGNWEQNNGESQVDSPVCTATVQRRAVGVHSSGEPDTGMIRTETHAG